MFSSHHPSINGELKSKAAVNAAADPHSAVTAVQAEQTLMDEAEKAGSPAYFFDPDAAPEEKAAIVHADLPQGFYQHKASAAGLVSDTDAGLPDAYELPSPTRATAVTPPSSTKEVKAKANGTVTSEEDQTRWVNRVGWAPRFGEGTMTEAEKNETLLDKTTALESMLDDKLFGDWYHNSAVIVFACLASWVVALLGGGLGWVFIVMAFCGTYYRTSIRRVRRNFRDDVHREMAKARLETDTESLEWINSFLVKFWPIYAPHLCEIIIASVDQILSTSTPAFVDSLRMKFFTLGTKPPRLECVKTYPKADDDIVLMDWKFSFTPGDKMDMTARQLKEKLNPKVVLEIRLGIGLVSKALDVIVEDFAFSGNMRVKVKLQGPFPHIEKVDICFLDKPVIDYVCKPLGGETLGFDINFIPGLESFIIEMIHGTLQPIMYDPNVFPIEIAKIMAGNAVDQAIGIVAVTLHGAQGLKNPDALSSSPDPYSIVSLDSRDVLGKTKIVKQTANPRWNETIYVIVTSLTATLTLQVFDFNEFRKDKELGMGSFAMDRFSEDPEHENLQLDVMSNGKQRGILQTDMRFFPVLEGLKLEDGKQEPPPESNTGIARFTVEQARDLDGSKSMVGHLNPYAVLLLNGKEVHESTKLKRTNRPIWPDGSKEFFITDRRSARLGVVIKDDRDLATDPVLGTYQVKLDDMMKFVDEEREWFQLSGAKTGSIKLLLQWKPVSIPGIMGSSGGYTTPIGVMRFHFQSARDLRNVETMGKSDPYVRVLLSGIEKAKTVTFQNNLNPDFDEVVYVPVHSPRERLVLEVMDYQNMTKDRSLGLTEISAADYIKEGDNGEYEVHNHRRDRSEPLRMYGGGPPKGTLNFTVAFYPTLNIVDPDDEEAEKALAETTNDTQTKTTSKASSVLGLGKTPNTDPVAAANENEEQLGKVDSKLANQLSAIEEREAGEVKAAPKIRLTPDELVKHDTGLLIFKLIEGDFARSDLLLEVLMDDMAFPSYSFSKATSKHTEFGETGDAMVRELDMSRITLRLVQKEDKKGGEQGAENVFAKLVGDTLQVLQKSLYTPTEWTLKGADGSINKIKISLKYLPINMSLDPSESMSNMGTLRVDVLEGSNLPSADRNGYSDPYCKFELNGEGVFKSKTQKKTLQPIWNESFEIPIRSRTAANFIVRVMDWDMGDKDDFLGAAKIDLTQLEPQLAKDVTLPLDGKSGQLRLRLLFKSSYVTRSRQGSSTFHGTMGTATKVIGAPVKGVGKVGGGVVKGASFFRHGMKSSKDMPNGTNGATIPDITNGSATVIPSIEEPQGVSSSGGNLAGTTTPQPIISAGGSFPMPNGGSSDSPGQSLHNRTTSFGSKSAVGAAGGTPGAGVATFTIVSASGFAAAAKVQVHVKQMNSKGNKEVYKTKGIKSPSGQVQWDNETFKVSCSPDTQFQIQVKDDKRFSSEDLGEALFVIDDSGTGSEKAVTCAGGNVVIKSSFAQADAGSIGSSPKGATRRSFLSKKESSRQGTPS
ncbi:hypothetical protein MMC18_004710 [Xylographa bjoerkii]|nr:hypothetical protein [Xylographa bjoerkii]